jgi:hypothetical protein
MILTPFVQRTIYRTRLSRHHIGSTVRNRVKMKTTQEKPKTTRHFLYNIYETDWSFYSFTPEWATSKSTRPIKTISLKCIHVNEIVPRVYSSVQIVSAHDLCVGQAS